MTGPAEELKITGDLPDWAVVKDKFEWGGILLGNGASCAVWDGFEYPSLYEAARSPELEHALVAEDEALFLRLETKNFEAVLATLRQARQILVALDLDATAIDERYNSVRSALVAAVHSVHPPWHALSNQILRAIGTHLLEYEVVYSTNYDLIVYWSRMSIADGSGFKDYFWGPTFDLSNTEISGKVTRVLNLHGALHLYRKDGRTHKRKRQSGENLLEQFTSIFDEGGIPLFVSEGTSEDKLSVIERNDYLSFAFSEFSRDHEPLVVFGHSLNDAHLRAGMTGAPWETRTIAISVAPGNSSAVIARKLTFHQLLPQARLLFFDASSHPLGATDLRVPVQ